MLSCVVAVRVGVVTPVHHSLSGSCSSCCSFASIVSTASMSVAGAVVLTLISIASCVTLGDLTLLKSE